MISRHGSGYSSYTESSEIIVHEHIASDFRRKSPLTRIPDKQVK